MKRLDKERLAEIANGPPGRGPTMEECIGLATELMEHRAGQAGVKVRELEWPNDKTAITAFGLYQISVTSNGSFDLHYSGMRLGNFPSKEKAKAATQADYEQRILSALASPLPNPPVVDEAWLRDTAMNVMLATEVEEAVRILTAAIGARHDVE